MFFIINCNSREEKINSKEAKVTLKEDLMFIYENVHKLGIYTMWITDDSRFLITISQDQTIKIFDIYKKSSFVNDPIHFFNMNLAETIFCFQYFIKNYFYSNFSYKRLFY